MSANTTIEWCDHTFNPWEGCTKVSPGCDNCFAEARNRRFGKGVAINWGPGALRRRTGDENWKLAKRWNSASESGWFMECVHCGWRGLSNLSHDCGHCDKENTLIRARPRVFCGSLCDVFDNEVPAEWRQELFELIRATPHLDWLLLTKRIGNAKSMIEAALCNMDIGYAMDFTSWPFPRPFPNVWLGATFVSQSEYDRDIHKLLAVPAARRFLSIEPMLSPIKLTSKGVIPADDEGPIRFGYMVGPDDGKSVLYPTREEALHKSGLHWVICGGESGQHARPMHPNWARFLRDQCISAEVPFFFKQWGSWIEAHSDKPTELVHLDSEAGLAKASECNGFISQAGDFVRSMKDACTDDPYRGMQRVGKKAAGRLLDGRLHNQFPEPT